LFITARQHNETFQERLKQPSLIATFPPVRRVLTASICLAATCLSVPAEAVTPVTPRKPVKLTTASKTIVFGGLYANGAAIAKCPAGTKVVSGGFAATPPTSGSGPRIVPYESRRVDQRRWRASGTNVSRVAGGSLTAFAYCRRLPKRQKIRAVNGGAVVRQLPATGQARARCPRRQSVVSGGFLVPPQNAGSPQVLVSESTRGDSRTWLATGVDLASKGTATVTSYAYCLPVKSAKQVFGTAEVPASTSSGTPSATAFTQPCPTGRAIGGGFASPYVHEGLRSAVLVYQSQLSSSTTWAASGVETGGARGSGTLIAGALCG
jgi:hypothetical protein